MGDWIDGSDAGLISESELMKLRDSFKSSKVPYLMIKGNHDENDKFDEHHDLKASFPEREFEKIMWPEMYRQRELGYVSRQHGVAWFDQGHVRVISLNTSDIPTFWMKKGGKSTMLNRFDGFGRGSREGLEGRLQERGGRQDL